MDAHEHYEQLGMTGESDPLDTRTDEEIENTSLACLHEKCERCERQGCQCPCHRKNLQEQCERLRQMCQRALMGDFINTLRGAA